MPTKKAAPKKKAAKKVVSPDVQISMVVTTPDGSLCTVEAEIPAGMIVPSVLHNPSHIASKLLGGMNSKFKIRLK